jgi:hypothetical protein
MVRNLSTKHPLSALLVADWQDNEARAYIIILEQGLLKSLVDPST